MAGFFGLFNYAKEGPGVDKDVPQKNRFIVFFEIYGRKFWKLCVLNLIYVALALIPFILSALLITLLSGLNIKLLYDVVFYPDANPDVNVAALVQNIALFTMLGTAPLILTAPLKAGMARITRDFVREESVFLWSDFKQAVKSNLKSSLLVGLIQYVLSVGVVNAFVFYYINSSKNFAAFIPLVLILLLGFITVSAGFYIYTMLVTFNLTLRKLIKNAAIFSFLCLFKNLLMIIVTALLYVGLGVLAIFSLGYPIVMIVLFLLIFFLFFAFLSYFNNFVIFPSLKRYIIDPYYESNPEETAEGVLEKIKSDDKAGKEQADDLPEYVYENGRMVHRSLLESESVFDEQQRIPGDDENE